MNFVKQEEKNFILYETEVENFFIYEYMPKAPGDFVKAYLFALMYAETGKAFSEEDLKKNTGLSSDDLERCWEYWEKEGCVKRVRNKKDIKSYDIRFLNLREKLYGQSSEEDYSEAETAVLSEKELSDFYSQIEQLTGRLLEGKEPFALAGLIKEDGLSPQLILRAYKYCIDAGKSSKFRYVEQILKNWISRGIKTTEDAEEYIEESNERYKSYKRIYRELGIKSSPGEAAKKLMDSWFDRMNFSMDKILEACGKTTGISNPNINYVNTILESWYRESREPAAETVDVNARVLQLYEKDRKENSEKTAANRRMVYSELPELRRISDELKSAGYKLARAMLSPAGKAAVLEEEKRIAALNKEKEMLLRDAGFDINILEDVYTCSICKDTGRLEDGSTCPCYAKKIELIREEGK